MKQERTIVRPVNITGFTQWTSSIDYLTCSTQFALDVPKFRATAEAVRLMAVIAGAVPKEMNWQGYRGWRCGDMFYGERNDGAVLDVKGALADIAWEQIKEHIGNVSRIDIALSVWHHMDTTEIISEVSKIHICNTGKPEEEIKPRPLYIKGYGEGDTYYVGAKSSNKRLRIYDKQRQSKHDEYKHCTRWELQYRNQDAHRIHLALTKQKDRISHMAGIVQRQCEDWQVPYPYVTNTKPAPILLSYRPSDLDTKKKWFGEQVASAVRRMGYQPGMENTMKFLVDTIRIVGYDC